MLINVAMARPGPALLQEWRKRTQLNQAQAAARVGVDQSQISEYERGRAVPRVDTAHRIELVTSGAVPMIAWIDPAEPGGTPREDPAETGDSAA
jgi:transcriptional regulator with XRE-family HTH domain